MDLLTLKIESSCIADDATLTSHVAHALSLGLPEIQQHPAHDLVAVLVGSGPSVISQLDSIKRQQQRGRPVFAIKDAHDWLLVRGVVPQYAVAIDPQAHRWNCFTQRHPDVHYLIASQCHPAMFAHLAGHHVYLWHLQFNHGAAFPTGTLVLGGCTTTGLRAITMLYAMGFRRFELYGYDSCLSDGLLRVNGDRPKEGNQTIPIVLDVTPTDRRVFYCNPGMAAQALEFQDLFTMMPEITVQSHGEGLLTAILEAREYAAQQQARETVLV